METLEEQSIEYLDLTVRGYRYCRKYGIKTIGDLMKLSNEEVFYAVCNRSKIVYREITTKLPVYISRFQEETDQSLNV